MKKVIRSTLLSAIVIATLTLNHEVAEANYSDISSTHWASNAIQELTDLELIQGFPDGTFRPNQTVTEAEFVAMLLRTIPEEVREKRPEEKWSDPYYEYAQLKHFPLNYSNTSARNIGIKRVTVAELIAHSHGNNFQGNRAIQYLLEEGLAKGKRPNDNSISSYDGQGTLTRAEAVTFMQRLLSYDPGQEQEKVAGKPKSHLELYGDRHAAAEDLLKNVRSLAESLGYQIENHTGTIMFGDGNFNRDLTFMFLGTGYPGFYIDDFRVTNLNYGNEKSDELFDEVLRQYGFSTNHEFYELLEDLNIDESLEINLQGYDLYIYKNRIAETDDVLLSISFTIYD